ncbi:MAG: ferrous iron transporter B, partial [Legionellales bacterium]
MYLLFGFAVSFGGYLEATCIDPINRAIIIGLQNISTNNAIVVDGLGRGIATMLSFIPVLMCAFVAIAALEHSGYIARAERVVHSLVNKFGLSGKSLITIIIGFGCNVPAILNTKHLNTRQERIQAALMSPFMSCSARLAIYTVFTAAFFPVNGLNIIFSLYLAGILVAVLTGIMLRGNQKDLPQIATSNSNNKLPEYNLPNMYNILRSSWRRTRHFLNKAGKIIVPFCIIIACLNNTAVDTEHSVLAKIGKSITPIFQPMGLTQDNWQASVALLTGVLAKEALVGTLGSLYDAPEGTIETALADRFTSKAAAFAYLLFVLLYFPCISVITAISKELNKKWAAFSVVWTTGVAYIAATVFYQA